HGARLGELGGVAERLRQRRRRRGGYLVALGVVLGQRFVVLGRVADDASDAFGRRRRRRRRWRRRLRWEEASHHDGADDDRRADGRPDSEERVSGDALGLPFARRWERHALTLPGEPPHRNITYVGACCSPCGTARNRI